MDVEDQMFEMAKEVKSRADFVSFVKALNGDYAANRSSWENDSLQRFLDGLSGFASDMDGFYRNMGETVNVDQITWRMAAQMLLAATVYGA